MTKEKGGEFVFRCPPCAFAARVPYAYPARMLAAQRAIIEATGVPAIKPTLAIFLASNLQKGAGKGDPVFAALQEEEERAANLAASAAAATAAAAAAAAVSAAAAAPRSKAQVQAAKASAPHRKRKGVAGDPAEVPPSKKAAVASKAEVAGHASVPTPSPPLAGGEDER